jgi:membrane protein implicated in regulation of membrane protease activity
MAPRSPGARGGVPVDLVLVLVLTVVVLAAVVWAAKGSLYWTALIIVFVLGALMWAYARRIRRREDMSADQQRKVKHDSSWTSEREEE